MAGSKGKILIVDDDVFTLDALRRNLMREADVVTALSGSDALNLAKGGDFAVVLTDLMMPGMNGYELVAELNIHSPQTICVVLTGKLESPFPNGLPPNVLLWLQKPVGIDKLVQVLHSALAEFVLRSVGSLKSEDGSS